VGPGLDQALAFQDAQGFAYDGARDAVAAFDLLVVQAVAGPQFAGCDEECQCVGEVFDAGAVGASEGGGFHDRMILRRRSKRSLDTDDRRE